jgi:hypothetical protein
MKRNKLVLLVLSISLACFVIVTALISRRIISPEMLSVKSFSILIPLVTGIVVSTIFIGGYFYFARSGKIKDKYKTLPIYGIAVMLEAAGDMISERYALILMILSGLILAIAITIDIRQKVGLYLLFKKNETKEPL